MGHPPRPGLTGPSPDTTGRGGSPSIAHPDYWWYRARSTLLRSALEGYVGTPRRMLDVGSADGPSVGWLREHGPVVSLDIDPRGLAPGDVCGSVLRLPFADASFDVVTAFDVLEHCEPEDAAVAELRRVLAPGGRLLASVPAYQWAWTDFDVANGHHRRYTRARLVRALRRSGLEVDRASYAFAAVFPFFAAQRLATRAAEAAARRTGRPGATGPADVVAVPRLPRPVEELFVRLSRVDQALLRSRDLPFGSSVFVAATRPLTP